MYQQQKSGWLKHWDFVVLDIFCFEVAFWMAYFIRNLFVGLDLKLCYEMSVLLIFFSIAVRLVLQPYSGILRRGVMQEFGATTAFVSLVMGCELTYLFMVQFAEVFSRMLILLTWVIGIFLMFIARVVRKKFVLRELHQSAEKRAMVLLVGQENAAHVLEELTKEQVTLFQIQAIFFLDEAPKPELVAGIELPLIYGRAASIEFLEKNVVDELFIRLPNGEKTPEDFMNVCRNAGIAVHVGLARKKEVFGTQTLELIGNYYALTNSIRVITPMQAKAKRLMDICGALVGLFFTAIITLFVGPFIYFASPGPIFFSQTRIGRNGRSFKFYKFRSMYLDAEERKAELMAQNKMNGLMFKIDDDPRIIKGVGHFIRKTSLDEFPQFWNVLRGDMSLVGTRPPTLGEYEQYNLAQKSRLAFKPGITGLWQISGRSDIVDFDEVIRLDTEYIETWTILEDVRILMRTVLSVLGQKGSG